MAKEYLDKDGLLYLWQKIKNTFALVSHTHTKSQITDFPTTMTPSSHTHGNIQNGGTLQTTDVAVANGDKLVITDASSSNKVARSSVVFDGSTENKALTPKGTWKEFNNYTHPSYTAKTASAVKVGNDATGHVVIGSALVKGDVGLGNVDNTSDADKPISTATQTALDDKVDVVDGKGLSTNDYTTDEKNKLAGIPSGAEENVLEGVQMDGTDLTITSKKVNIPVFTGAASDANGSVGLVPAMTKGTSAWKYILTNNGWKGLNIGSATASDETKNARIALAIDGSSISYMDIRSASTTKAGVMTASDKTKLDKLVFDSNNLIDSSILPSYVDDVIEAYARSGQTALSSTWLATGSASGTVITPETGKIYVLMADSGDYSANTQFRWGGSAYVKLNDGGVSAITNAEIDTIIAS